MPATTPSEQAALPIHEGQGEAMVLALDLMDAPPFQFRTTNKDQDQELRESLLRDGLTSPITVQRTSKGGADPNVRYRIIKGNRRVEQLRVIYNAAAGLTVPGLERGTVDAIVREYPSDAHAARDALVDNMKRTDLTPLDEAQTFQAMMDLCEWTAKQMAEFSGRSERFVKARLAMLAYKKETKAALAAGKIGLGDAEMFDFAAQIGLGGSVLKAMEPDRWGRANTVTESVRQAFSGSTVDLDGSTPFEWKVECKKAGCLAKDPRGDPVCTNPVMWFKLSIEERMPLMQERAQAFLTGDTARKHGVSSDGVPISKDKLRIAGEGKPLSVFFDVDRVGPNLRGYDADQPRRPKIPGCPAVPFAVGTEPWDMDKGGYSFAHTVRRVSKKDKPGCLSCPAYTGKGPGRAIVITSGSRRSPYGSGGGEPGALLVCANLKCREDKFKASGKKAAVKPAVSEAAKKREKKREQEDVAPVVLPLVNAMAKDRRMILALPMVRRYTASENLRWEHDYECAFKALGIKLPLKGKGPDALLHQIASLSEKDLCRINAWKALMYTDNAKQYIMALNDHGINPEKLRVTAGLYLKDEQVEQAFGQYDKDREAEKAARRAGKNGAKPKTRKPPAKRKAKAKAKAGA